MQRSFQALLVLILFLLSSCSWFMESYDGPTIVTHGYVQGVSPDGTDLHRSRSYPTVQANWPGPGGDKIWLAVNLGATGEPQTSVDTSPRRAGWYFQFNRKQGFYNNGSIVLPRWYTSRIDENSTWEISNDPCRLLLGNPWRLPVIEELRAFRTAPLNRGGMGEGNRTSAFNSDLKLHATGFLHSFDGSLRERGETGSYWASDQFSTSRGEAFNFGDASGTFASNKAFGRAVRCLKDE